MKCNTCEKELSHDDNETHWNDGHYNYSGFAYCIECWEEEHPNPLVTVLEVDVY